VIFLYFWMYTIQIDTSQYEKPTSNTRHFQTTKFCQSQIINGFRHYLVSYLRDNGSHIHFIQEIVGHQGSKTTEIYMPLSKKLLPNISSLK
jgi:site-specific recombinase XerD